MPAAWAAAVTAAGAGAIGFNEIRNTVRATVSGATLNSSSFVTISATENARIKAVSVGIAGTLAGGMGVGIGLSGAGSGSKNNIYNVVEAQILADSIVASGAGCDVTVSASDTSEIGSFAGALAFAITGAIASVGLAVGKSNADNDLGNDRPREDQRLEGHLRRRRYAFTASATSKIVSGAAAGGVGISVTVAAGFGAALSSNNIHNTVEAIIEDSDLGDTPAQSVSGTSVTVKAEDDSDILSTSLGALGRGVRRRERRHRLRPVGQHDHDGDQGRDPELARRLVGRRRRGARVVQGLDHREADRGSDRVSGGGSVSGGGVLSKNTVTPSTTATINGGSSVSGATHVKVEAKDESSIDATIVAVSVAGASNAVAIGISRAENTIGGSISASISGSTVVALGGAADGDIDVLASANQTVTTFSVLLSAAFGAIAAAGAAPRRTSGSSRP